MRPITIAILLAASAFLGPDSLAGTDRPEAGRLYLRTGEIETSTLRDLRLEGDEASAPGRRYVLQLDGPMTPARRETLRSVGIDLGDYLPMHAYLVTFDEVSPADLLPLTFVRWVGEFRNEWKLDPSIGTRTFATSARKQLHESGHLSLICSLFSGADLVNTSKAVQQIGAIVVAQRTTSNHSVIHILAGSDRLPMLAALPDIQFIEEAPELTARNDTNEWIVQSNVVNVTPIWDSWLYGEGQVGGLIDWPVKTTHCSFEDDVPIGPDHRKIVAYRGAAGSDTHGTHVAGSFVGDSGTWGGPDFRDGIALAAKLSYSSAPDVYVDPSSLILRLQDAHADGAAVHSNSWGDDGTTSYTTWCEQIDRFSREEEEDLVVFASTNLSTLKTPENAKNVLAVGGTSDTPNQHNHCKGGTGPTSDGRRKPELFAPGCSTMSSSQSTSCSWLSYSGTSMAAPVISGAGLLIRQYFQEGFYPEGYATPGNERTPTGALLKAILLNATVDMTGVAGYPSDKEGWGRLLLDNSLFFLGDSRRLFVADVRNDQGLSTDESLTYTLDVLDVTEPLRVTLVWTDVPATIGASYAPINNLDLSVTSSDGLLFWGNNFKDGESDDDGVADAVNNVEQVHRLVPVPGEYAITVTATEVNEGTQGFALVVTGDIELPPTDCVGDVNGSGVIDPLDAGAILARFCDQGPCDPAYDVNGDGFIDPLDVGFVMSRFGNCP